MNAAALIILILAIIGFGLALYYTMICLQVRKPKRRKPSDSDMGPLLNNEEDVNGNHEAPVRTEDSDRPIELPEASAPKPEDENDNPTPKERNSETPLKSVTFQSAPECASVNLSSKEGSIALDIDEEPPILDDTKSVLQPQHERMFAPQVTSPNLQASNSENPNIKHDIPYSAMSNSYEEDGLLVPESSQHKILQKEPRRRLHAQRSAPHEGYVPPQQLIVQKNSHPVQKHVQFVNPRSPVPVFVTDCLASNAVRPILKSPYSDPGTSKENNLFVFGESHEDERSDEKTVKKVKMEAEDEEKKDNNKTFNKELESCNQDNSISTPPVGWVVPPNILKINDTKHEIILNIDDNNENRGTLETRLNISEIDHASIINEEGYSLSSDTMSKDKINPKLDLGHSARASDSDSLNSDDVCNLNSKELRLNIELQEETGSESSEPDLTEYSFERGLHTPDLAVSTVLQNEVSSYPDKVGLTNYIPIPESIVLPTNQQSYEDVKIIGQPPPTPTSDTKSVSPINSNDNSLDEISAPSPSSLIPTNVLGTPPQTPPNDQTSEYIEGNLPQTVTDENSPSFVIIDSINKNKRRGSSDSNISSSTISSSSSDGSYKLDPTNDDINTYDETTIKRCNPEPTTNKEK